MSDVSSTSSTTYTGISGAGGGDMIRITGMATGLDVDGMVKKMMAAEQTKLDKVKQEQQIIQWKQDAYKDIIKDIKDLQSSFFDSLNSSTSLLSPSNYAGLDFIPPTDSTIMSGSVAPGAKTGTYTVDFTDGHLASAATKTGERSIINDTSASFSPSNWIDGKIGFSINGNADETITLSGITDASTATDVAKEINNEISKNSKLNGKVQAVESSGKIQFRALTDVNVKISNSATNTTIATDLDNLKGMVINPNLSTVMGDLGLPSTGGSFTIDYNGNSKTITVNASDKISDVINNISTQTGGAVTASFSQLSGKFTIQTSNTGSVQSLQINKSTGTNFDPLGLNADATAHTGQDAVVNITPPGGSEVTVTKSTNNFTIDGVTYNLLKDTDASTNTKIKTTFSVSVDIQKVHDKIKGFLDKYNAIVDKIQTKLNEKKDYDYAPLTDTQKSSMKDADITTWNEKAQQGILRNDDNLQNLLSQLRSAFVTPLTDSTGKSLTSVYFGKNGDNAIGIDTSDDYSQGAKITIVDDTKLNNAIQNHGADILKLFTNVSTADQSTDAGKTQYFNESGIMQRFNDILKTNVGYTGTTFNDAILTKYANVQDDFSITGGGSGTNTLPDQIYYKQLMITKINDELKTKQEKYYEQFSQLETAMNDLNNQQAQLTSMLGG